jgi:kynurenine formamidase
MKKRSFQGEDIMCSPWIARLVRERIAREGLPKSAARRNFLKTGAAAAAGLAVAQIALPQRLARASEGGMASVIDLSHVFGEVMPTYVPGETPTREDFVTVERDGFFIQRWHFSEHAGTHMDFPAHFIADGQTVDVYAVAPLVSPAVVIDIRAKAEADPDAALDVADLEAFEAEHGPIPDGAVVIMNSGWATRWSSVEDFRNADADGVMHFPGFSAEAMNWLLENRAINGIGVDTLSLDPGISTTFDVHYACLGAGLYGYENLTNLDQLPPVGATIIAGIPRWEASGGGPTRALALV